MSAADSSAEWRLLTLASVCDATDKRDERSERARELTERPLDPDRLVGMAVRHGLAPLLAHFLQSADRLSILPVTSKRHLRESLERNRYRTGRHVREALRIVHQLREAGLTAAVTKGVAAQATLYDRAGTRWFNDIDLMTLPDERSAVAKELAGLRYAEGKAYHHASGRLVDIPRGEMVAYQLYPDHLPHFTRVTGEEVLPYFVVDVAFSLTWYTAGWQIPIGDALGTSDSVEVDGGRLPILPPVFDFLFLCLHLFREGWLATTIATKDVRLAQFADICRHWERHARHHGSDLRAAIDRYRLHAPVGWVVGHTDALFGTAIGAALGLAAHTGPDWLGSASVTAGTYLYWPGTMSQRLARPGPPPLTAHPRPDAVAALVS